MSTSAHTLLATPPAFTFTENSRGKVLVTDYYESAAESKRRLCAQWNASLSELRVFVPRSRREELREVTQTSVRALGYATRAGQLRLFLDIPKECFAVLDLEASLIVGTAPIDLCAVRPYFLTQIYYALPMSYIKAPRWMDLPVSDRNTVPVSTMLPTVVLECDECPSFRNPLSRVLAAQFPAECVEPIAKYLTEHVG